MDKYVITEPRDSSDNQDLIDDNVYGDNMNAHRIDDDNVDGDNMNVDGINDDNVDDDTVNVDGVSHTDVDVGVVETNTDNINVDNPNANVDHVNIFDPRNWDGLSSDMIKALAEGGVAKGSLVNEGFSDWAHLTTRLKEHEDGLEHITNMATWFDMRRRLKKNEAIDNVVHEQFERERYHWTKVLLRIISIVKFLAKHNLAFRVLGEKFHVDSNGNFLGLIEMLEEFDPFIKKHVRRITSDEIHIHYLGHSIQNELIQLLARGIKSQIIQKIKQAKYFSVILDCTPDTSHQEQMSLILRYVNVGSTCVSVEESFLGFLIVDDTTGQGLFDVTQIREALLQVVDTDNDSKIKSESKSLATNEEFRDTGFDKAINVAKEIAIEMDIDPVFRQKRVIRRKRKFDENYVDEKTTYSVEEAFKVQYFLYIVDQALVSLRTRFEQYKEYERVFGFLFTPGKLNSLDENTLKSHCSHFEAALKNNEQSDVDAKDLFVELRLLNNYLPKKNMRPSDILNFLKEHDVFPNAMIAYRILLTMPIIVALAERSFSKLKLLKSYLRSTMSQEILNGLALIAIENRLLESVDYEDLINNFASKNARRIAFLLFLRSGETISRQFNRCLLAILKLHDVFLKKPQPINEDCEDNRWNCLKGCLGALDGTSISVTPPSDQKPRYRTRKGNITTNMLGVCCPNMQFIYVFPGWEGSAHDGRVLRDAVSRVDGLKIPQGCYYLVDAGYCNAPGFLAPFRELEQVEEDETEDEQQFEDAGYLTRITPTDEWFNFRHDLAHQMFNSWREVSNP
uniref:Zinc finger MYM-type protein 1 n=1 Tax=Tanacetum cinerariifolium TaxID=118510 RepID=A0A6L2NXA1_TANCI|nr:zinc finger MYM-type protein 1 [Tanacetum cinerariifolium]